ncbi:helix-turn-helix domain-containing protein [Actinoplanes sp. NPDC048967]|uniref:helix-turn-helix domain-containing protein n=1 Tax=Actinoplanes sp. NPDC048967 TaxID=3155269 RepID=UPI0033F3E11E
MLDRRPGRRCSTPNPAKDAVRVPETCAVRRRNRPLSARNHRCSLARLPVDARRAAGLQAVQGEATAGELADLTGLSRTAVLNHLRTLTETGAAVAVGAARSPKRRYQWIAPTAPPQ